jgi:methyl-accepting chemotaxis protein
MLTQESTACSDHVYAETVDSSYVLLIGLVGGFVFGGLIVLLSVRPAYSRTRQQAADLQAEGEELRRKLAQLTTGTAELFDAAARRIDQTTREAERTSRARSEVDAEQWSVLEPIATDTRIDLEDVDRITRHAETAIANVGAGLRDLAGETAGLERASGFIADLAAAFETESSDHSQIDALAESAAETINAAAAMDDAIQRVQDRATETAELSAKTSTEAERGYRAVHRTLDEIERIRDLTGAARPRINALNERVEGIGDVVRVIQEITEKTNLLALNASIIAAQAGQHGRSFAVVAREIKALAQRTAASTKEISEQIRGVQDESERATAAMANGATAVAEGFQVAVAAGDALTAIRESALTAQRRVQSMTRAYRQQSSATRQVVDLAGKVSERAQVFTSSARGQTPERLAAAAAELQAVAARIGELVTAQREASTTANESFAEVVAEVARLARLERDLRKHVGTLHRSAGVSREHSEQLSGQLELVRQATTQLRKEIGRLQQG